MKIGMIMIRTVTITDVIRPTGYKATRCEKPRLGTDCHEIGADLCAMAIYEERRGTRATRHPENAGGAYQAPIPIVGFIGNVMAFCPEERCKGWKVVERLVL